MTAPPNPSKVKNIEEYWADPPPEPSARCLTWMHRIESGWRENRRIAGMGYYYASEWYGVYIWEYLYVIVPLMQRKRAEDMLVIKDMSNEN